MWVESTAHNAAESLFRTMGLTAHPETRQECRWEGKETLEIRGLFCISFFSLLLAKFCFVFIHMICSEALTEIHVKPVRVRGKLQSRSEEPQGRSKPFPSPHGALTVCSVPGPCLMRKSTTEPIFRWIPVPRTMDTWLGGLWFCACGFLSARQCGSLALGRFFAQLVTWLSVPVCSPPATRIYRTQWGEVLGFVIATGAIFFPLRKKFFF